MYIYSRGGGGGGVTQFHKYTLNELNTLLFFLSVCLEHNDYFIYN